MRTDTLETEEGTVTGNSKTNEKRKHRMMTTLHQEGPQNRTNKYKATIIQY